MTTNGEFPDDMDDLDISDGEKQEFDPQKYIIQNIPLPMKRHMILPSDKELIYTQKIEPRCSLCRHELRDQAEIVYFESGKNIRAVERFLDEMGEHKGYATIHQHMKRHCIWAGDEDDVNILDRVSFDMAEFREKLGNDELGFAINLMQSLKMRIGKMDVTKDIDTAVKVGNLLSKITDTEIRAIKTRSDLLGAMSQARAYSQAREKKMIDFLGKLLSRVKDIPDVKMDVIQMMEEFATEMNEQSTTHG